MSPDPFFPYDRPGPKSPPVKVTTDPLNSDEERAKLTDLTIGTTGSAPHEAAAVLRMHRAGFTGTQMSKTLGDSPHLLVKQVQKSLDDEGEAHRRGRPIHDAHVPKGTK